MDGWYIINIHVITYITYAVLNQSTKAKLTLIF